MDNDDPQKSVEKRPLIESSFTQNAEGFYSFRLTVVNAKGPQEVAGELWDVAKGLREGTVKAAYGNMNTPCRVEWEIAQQPQVTATSAKASAKVSPDGTQTAEASTTKTTTTSTETTKPQPQ